MILQSTTSRHGWRVLHGMSCNVSAIPDALELDPIDRPSWRSFAPSEKVWCSDIASVTVPTQAHFLTVLLAPLWEWLVIGSSDIFHRLRVTGLLL